NSRVCSILLTFRNQRESAAPLRFNGEGIQAGAGPSVIAVLRKSDESKFKMGRATPARLDLTRTLPAPTICVIMQNAKTHSCRLVCARHAQGFLKTILPKKSAVKRSAAILFTLLAL